MVLVLVFFLVLGTFTAFVFNREALRRTQATNPEPPTQSASFVLAHSDGTTCTVNPVVRDSQERAVADAEVCVTSTLGTVNPSCAPTNEAGVSEHIVTSDTAGAGQISAEVTGQFRMTTQVTCTFN